LRYKFGKLAVSLAEKLNAQKVKAKICLEFGAHTMHWKDHFKETVPILIEGYQSGVETWDFEYAGLPVTCANIYILSATNLRS
jgi:predicted ATPase